MMLEQRSLLQKKAITSRAPFPSPPSPADADKTWLDQVADAANGYGWNDDAVNTDGINGGLVGTMATGTLTDCNISGDSIDSVKVTAAGTAGGLVGTAMDARVFKCSAQNITIAGGKTSGGLAGTFAATGLATGDSAVTSGGVMAMCYERNCEVTGSSHCDMIQTADKALILACYASKAAPNPVGVYAVKTATGSKFVGCYTSANQAPKFAYEGVSTYDNCYFIGTGTSCAAADTVKGITADTMKAAVNGALTQMNSALQTAYDTVTDSLRMSYMSGNAPEIFGNYNYPMYAAWMLTVNTAPGSVYGSYTVTANGKIISAPGATGLNQYWVGNGTDIVVTGGKDKSFVQLTSDVGMTGAEVAKVINSFAFAATKPEGGDVTINVQVYVDENLRGAMYFNGRSVYELSGSPANYASAKLLAETSSFGGMQGHLVVIGDSNEHKFLTDNVKTNAWTAAKSTGDNTVLTNWAWDVTGTPDASYLKNQSVEQTVSFKDVEAQAWYAQAVNTLASLKVIEGRGNDYFDPMAYISRAEFTAIAMRVADSIKGTFTFNDVPADYWAESFISGAAQYGWIMGYEDGSFKPLESIKRAEAAKIVNTMLWRFPDTKFIDKAEGLKTFPDLVKGNWAYYDVAEATNAHDFTQTKTGTETWKK